MDGLKFTTGPAADWPSLRQLQRQLLNTEFFKSCPIFVRRFFQRLMHYRPLAHNTGRARVVRTCHLAHVGSGFIMSLNGSGPTSGQRWPASCRGSEVAAPARGWRQPLCTRGLAGLFCHAFHTSSLYWESLRPGFSSLTFASSVSEKASKAARRLTLSTLAGLLTSRAERASSMLRASRASRLLVFSSRAPMYSLTCAFFSLSSAFLAAVLDSSRFCWI
mmetsp:Transcript_6690/g.22852  ORF Transcript_6690/g.22852 Transcript_6690/m.22852 type:complete len:219 (-) Transcript_6690:339-995(-)